MTLPLGVIVVAVVAFVVPFEFANAQKSSACVSIDSVSLDERQTFSDMATGTDATSARLRLLYKLPVVADSAVVIVQDARDCAQALRALNRDQNRTHREGLRDVLVIRVGTVFVVSDPKYKVGEWTAYTVFDSRFKNVLASVAR
jgi:hypothetical protein